MQSLTTQNGFEAELRQSCMRSIEEDCRLPEEDSSEKESDNILVFARKRL